MNLSQPCHCGSSKCREVIGGRAVKASKNEAESKRKYLNSNKDNIIGTQDPSVFDRMKVLTRKDRMFIQNHQCFLVRNYDHVRYFCSRLCL